MVCGTRRVCTPKMSLLLAKSSGKQCFPTDGLSGFVYRKVAVTKNQMIIVDQVAHHVDCYDAFTYRTYNQFAAY
jgi:hypothetical protein